MTMFGLRETHGKACWELQGKSFFPKKLLCQGNAWNYNRLLGATRERPTGTDLPIQNYASTG